MIKINLLPVGVDKKKEKVMTQVYVGILVIIFALAAIGYRWYYQQTRIEVVAKQVKETEESIENLREAQKKYNELEMQKQTLERQVDAITKLDKGRDWFIRVIDKIAESVPHNQLWVNQIKFGGAGKSKRGSGGGAKSLLLTGAAYDRDAVAHFMGNLSIIPCDEDLPDEEKAPICRTRDEKCRIWKEEKGNYEWDFEGCRRFYRGKCDEAKSCREDVNICSRDEKTACKDPKSTECKEKKEKCIQLDNNCKQAGFDCAKLHEVEYVVYDSVRLGFMKTSGKDKKGTGTPVVSFEITCSATNPR